MIENFNSMNKEKYRYFQNQYQDKVSLLSERLRLFELFLRHGLFLVEVNDKLYLRNFTTW